MSRQHAHKKEITRLESEIEKINSEPTGPSYADLMCTCESKSANDDLWGGSCDLHTRDFSREREEWSEDQQRRRKYLQSRTLELKSRVRGEETD